MDFLIKQDLVEERTVGEKRVVYVITQRGITVIKAFRELKQVLPITEEIHRVSNSILTPIGVNASFILNFAGAIRRRISTVGLRFSDVFVPH